MRHRPLSSGRRLSLSLAAVFSAVVATGVGLPGVASAGSSPPAAVQAAPAPAAPAAPAVHDHFDGTHSHGQAAGCATPSHENADGEYQACTHGADPAPRGFDVERDVPAQTALALEASSVPCDGDGTTGKRVEILYVHGSTDRFAQYKASFVEWSIGMDEIFNASAQETGGQRHIRFVTEGAGTCTPIIRNVAIPDASLRTFNGSITAVRNAGYNREDRKYVMFADTNVYCGIGEFYGDERKSDSNRSNFGPSYGRVDTGCWDASTAAHELAHTLGAVNYGAPNTSNGGHCVDEWDVMCYSDSPEYPDMVIACPDRAQDERLDCNHDDYYSTAPAPGSYLATNFNMADNQFLIQGSDGGEPPPPPPAESKLVQTSSNRCLDLWWGRTTNNTAVQIWDCHNDGRRHGNQMFTRFDDGTLRVNGKCLDVYGHRTADGSLVVLWDCHSGPNQAWTLRDDGMIVSVESGKCLTTAGAGSANGTRAVISTCDGSAAQRWTQSA